MAEDPEVLQAGPAFSCLWSDLALRALLLDMAQQLLATVAEPAWQGGTPVNLEHREWM